MIFWASGKRPGVVNDDEMEGVGGGLKRIVHPSILAPGNKLKQNIEQEIVLNQSS